MSEASLALLENSGELVGWKPDRGTSWYEGITKGETLDETAPMLFRPTVSGEFPARWYIEDGSGRAVAFVANQRIFHPAQTLAVGYLGSHPDPLSSFMRRLFPQLLRT